ncbi:MAG: rhodanese-like domain-containing protein [Chitinophagaceae bacterium]|nr:rhodanese-like domain-containing protein [Chitinophagaceae bacterium]
MLRNILLSMLLSLLIQSKDKYQCLPCGGDCDKAVYDKPGTCRDCGMELVKSSTIVFKNLEPGAVCDYIASHPNTILLDVRTKDEYEGKADPDYGRLKNAINIPVQELEKRVGELEKYKNREILVYCSHSHRSPRASYLLTQHGFGHVVNMQGGMSVMHKGPCTK